MTSSDTGQTRLRSTQSAIDGPELNTNQAPDSEDENTNEEHKQSEVPSAETSQPQGAPNPWAPEGGPPPYSRGIVSTPAARRDAADHPADTGTNTCGTYVTAKHHGNTRGDSKPQTTPNTSYESPSSAEAHRGPSDSHYG